MTESAEKEPTMEEILSSIRRIISEEDEEPARAQESDSESDDDDDSDILDLTDMAPEERAAPAPAPVAAESDYDDILVLDEDDEVAPEPAPAALAASFEPAEELADIGEPEEEPEPEMARIGERDETDAAPGAASMDWGKEKPMSDRLVSDTAAGAAASAFARLQRSTRVPESADDKSLETIVRELLKPMLKDWLDANLPSIVEKKVREEVERIARLG